MISLPFKIISAPLGLSVSVSSGDQRLGLIAAARALQLIRISGIAFSLLGSSIFPVTLITLTAELTIRAFVWIRY